MGSAISTKSSSMLIATLAVARKTIGRTSWPVWLAVSALFLLPLSFTFDPLSKVQALGPLFALVGCELILFFLIATNLQQLRRPVSQRLLPNYPESHGAAALLFILLLAVAPCLIFWKQGFGFIVFAASITVLVAATCLFAMAGRRGGNWSFIILVLLAILLGPQFEILRLTDLAERVIPFTPWLSVLFFCVAAFLLQHWHSSLLRTPTDLKHENATLDSLRRLVDFRALTTPEGYSAKTGYLITPGFIKVQSLRDKPSWWWLRFGLQDPGRQRSGWFQVFAGLLLFWLFIPGPAHAAILIVVMTVVPLENRGRKGTRRRLYLQSRLESRQQFLQQLNYLGYINVAVGFTCVVVLVSLLEWFIPHDIALIPAFLASAAAYCLSLAIARSLSMIFIRENPLTLILNTVPVMFLAMYGYSITVEGGFPVSALALLTVVSGLIMHGMLTVWSRSEIEL